MRKLLQNEQGHWNPQIIAALIAATATLMTAIIAGVFGLIQLRAANSQADVPPASALTVEIDGPAEAPLGQQTFFTIISENADRAEWTIAGFGRDEINPFRQADQIYVEPIDEGQVGRTFTLLVTVYNEAGNQASARHRFEVTGPGIIVVP
jgi:hypothetical protein